MILKKILIPVLICTGLTVIHAQYGQCKLDDKPDGFATLEGGTTGGTGGTIVTVSTKAALEDELSTNDAKIVIVSGTIEAGGSIRVNKNKTIIGLGDNAKITNGGFDTYKGSNVIIRNITFVNAPEDAIKLQQETRHVWIDHCTFCDSEDPSYDPRSNTDHDGMIDVSKKSSFVTISWCLFYNHDKNILIGHSDGSSDDVGFLKTTLHHNYFNGTIQRNPRVRYGEVHAYNNVYENNLIYGVASACEADVVVEGCHFTNDTMSLQVGVPGFSPPGDLVSKNNVFVNCKDPQTRGAAFDPATYYTYTYSSEQK